MTRSAALFLTTLLALSVSACGTSKESVIPPPAATPTASASASTGDAETAKKEFLTEVSRLVDPDLTPQQHADQVAGGTDLVPTFTKLKAYVAEGGPKITFEIQNPTVTAQDGRADVQILSGGSPLDQTYPSFFIQQDGHWKITRTGACSLIAVSGITCPDA